MKTAAGSAATVYGSSVSGTIDQSVRRTFRVKPSNETVALVVQKLLELKDAIEKHFGVALKECEEPQFLRYEPGDYFVAHQDGNTPMIRDDSLHRRVSAIIFLSDPADYEGGKLLFHGRYPDAMQRLEVPAPRGSLVAFPPEQTHEVTPLTAGSRFTIATWYR